MTDGARRKVDADPECPTLRGVSTTRALLVFGVVVGLGFALTRVELFGATPYQRFRDAGGERAVVMAAARALEAGRDGLSWLGAAAAGAIEDGATWVEGQLGFGPGAEVPSAGARSETGSDLRSNERRADGRSDGPGGAKRSPDGRSGGPAATLTVPGAAPGEAGSAAPSPPPRAALELARAAREVEAEPPSEASPTGKRRTRVDRRIAPEEKAALAEKIAGRKRPEG